MAELVENDDVPRAAERRNGSHRSSIATRECQRRLGLFENGEGPIQRLMVRQGATNQARGPGAESRTIPGFHGRLFQGGMRCKAKIVIGREIQKSAAAPHDAHLLRPLNRNDPAQETLGFDIIQAREKKPIQRRTGHPLDTMRFISRTAFSKPTETARETIECPILSSSRPGSTRMEDVFW